MFEVLMSTLVGLLGTGLTSFIDYKNKKQEHEYQLKRLQVERELMVEEAKQSILLAEAEANAKEQAIEAVAYTESQKTQRGLMASLGASYNLVTRLVEREGPLCIFTVPVGVLLLIILSLADVLNKLMRPVLTLYSLAIASWVTYQSWSIVQEVATDAQIALAQWGQASETIILLSITLVTWWFGDRRVAQHLMHQKKGK